MDAITNFLFQNKQLKVSILFSVFYHLQVIQLQQPTLKFKDVEDTVKTVFESHTASNPDSPVPGENEVKPYAGIIYEACTIPKMGVDGPMFSLDDALTRGELAEQKLLERFLKVFVIRDQKLGGKYSSLIEEWRREGKKIAQPDPQTEKGDSSVEAEEESESLGDSEQMVNAMNATTFGENFSAYRSDSSHGNSGFSPLGMGFGNGAAVPAPRPVFGTVESNKFVARFLAHMRRSGMDMVFPQLIHDKVLLTVYVAAKCAGPIAHRDLIDMILAAKEARVLGTDLELVSKTKVRGVVTLGRNSHGLVVAEKGEGPGETVKLAIGAGLTNYRAFRKIHDSFLNLCLSQRHLFLPLNVKGEIVWSGDEKFVNERLMELRKDEALLEAYFLTGQRTKPTNPSPRSASGPSNEDSLGLGLDPSLLSGLVSTQSNSDSFTALTGLTSSDYSFDLNTAYDLPSGSQSALTAGLTSSSVGAPRPYVGDSSSTYTAAPMTYQRSDSAHSRFEEKGYAPHDYSGPSKPNQMQNLVHGGNSYSYHTGGGSLTNQARGYTNPSAPYHQKYSSVPTPSSYHTYGDSTNKYQPAPRATYHVNEPPSYQTYSNSAYYSGHNTAGAPNNATTYSNF